ncbi:MAG TPA: hypothetical protein VG326_15995 [Tepidisphaeraceae bacterium]|jgi:hypothetical protein|nr:hypothetical protein [Tepidisphaeraceae bacterium]
MPDQDIDPPAGPFGEEAGIKTPWESIDPIEPAQPAPWPKQAKRSNSPRRRAKSVGAELANPPARFVPTAVKAVETDAGGNAALGIPPEVKTHPLLPETPGKSSLEQEDAVVARAFFSDDYTVPSNSVGALPGLQSVEPADMDSDEALVELFVDGSQEEMPAVAIPDTRLTASVALGYSNSDAVTESFDNALAERMFLSGDSDVEKVTATETTAWVKESVAPAGAAGAESEPADFVPQTVLHVDAFAERASDVEQTPIAIELAMESAAEGAVTEFPAKAVGTGGSVIKPAIATAVAPSKYVAPITISKAPPLRRGVVQGDVEVKGVCAPAPPIRYLKPRPVVRRPAAASAVEIADATELDPEPELSASYVTTGGGWTFPVMCVGIVLIACCVVVPQADFNRRLYYQRQALQADLESIQKQVAVNDEFLKQVIDNPTLAERLASRQMKTIRKGQKVLAVNQVNDDGDMSPFALVAVPKPPTQTPYRPVIGTIANLCNNARSRLYLLGVSMTMVAVGLVLGFSPATNAQVKSEA